MVSLFVRHNGARRVQHLRGKFIGPIVRPVAPSLLLNAYATHRNPPPLSFPHVLRGRRDRSDPELAEHLAGFAGFITEGGARPMTATRYAVLRHLERVHHHVALEVEQMRFPMLAAWARDANAILFRTDGAVCGPDGRVLVSATTGDAERGAEVPYLRDARARKAISEQVLGERGVRVADSLPPVISEREVELREPRAVVGRCLALLVCALRAESISGGASVAVEALAKRLAIGVEALSPRERLFVATEAPAHQALVDHTWRYEALAVLAWAVHALDELPFPEAIVEVPKLVGTVLALDPAAWEADARLRPTSEILDALDLTFRAHWAVTDARVRNAGAIAAVHGGVVAERHHALNWLTRFEGADWDDVTTPT